MSAIQINPGFRMQPGTFIEQRDNEVTGLSILLHLELAPFWPDHGRRTAECYPLTRDFVSRFFGFNPREPLVGLGAAFRQITLIHWPEMSVGSEDWTTSMG